jgi:predicted nucleic acid-binding Zn ribbon protein
MNYSNEYNLGEAIAEFLEKYHLQEGYARVQIAAIWKKTVGKMIAAYTKKVELNSNILIIQITSPAVKQELMMLKTDIIKQLNKSIGKELIKEVEIW